MPELPEVETIIRDLKKSPFQNKEIVDIDVTWPRAVRGYSVEEFKNELIGNSIQDFGRRAKYLVFSISNGKTLILHLRMTGKLILHDQGDSLEEHDRVVYYFENGLQLHYNDTRKFGRFYLTDDPQEILGKLGPEPLSENFTLEQFRKNLSKRSRMIKSLLLDQSFIAGLGNIYTDEALWEAGIHPKQSTDLIPEDKQGKLYQAIKNVLQRGIKNKGTTLGSGLGNFARMNQERGRNSDSLQVYQRDGEKCYRCCSKIKKTKVSQRSTHFCPRCQKKIK